MSAKLDGVYCLVYGDEIFSRQLKLIPNRHLRTRLAPLIDYAEENDLIFMGELYDPSKPFTEDAGIVRADSADIGGTGFYAFDMMKRSAFDEGNGWLPFEVRYKALRRHLERLQFPFIELIPQVEVCNADEARRLYQAYLDQGFEGAVTRSGTAYYKFGRCRRSEQNLARHCEVSRSDVLVTDVIRGIKRRDSVKVPTLLDGRRSRSFKQDDYEPDEIAGSLRVRFMDGEEFGVGFGKGFTHDKRRHILNNAENYIGKIATIAYKKAGAKDAPRQPKLVCIRSDKHEPDRSPFMVSTEQTDRTI
jgi:ATP-dependent DNA ligase